MWPIRPCYSFFALMNDNFRHGRCPCVFFVYFWYLSYIMRKLTVIFICKITYHIYHYSKHMYIECQNIKSSDDYFKTNDIQFLSLYFERKIIVKLVPWEWVSLYQMNLNSKYAVCWLYSKRTFEQQMCNICMQ